MFTIPIFSISVPEGCNVNKVAPEEFTTYSNITSFKITNGISIYNSLDINIHTIMGIALSANRLAVIGYKGGIVT